MAIRRVSADVVATRNDVILDAYRRVVELDAAMTEAVAVDPELHRWCESRLAELLELLEPHVRATTDAEPPPRE